MGLLFSPILSTILRPAARKINNRSIFHEAGRSIADTQAMDKQSGGNGYGRFAAVAMDGHLKTQCDDVVFPEPIQSYFGALDVANVHSRSSSAAIPIIWKDEKSLEVSGFRLTLSANEA